MTGNGGLTFLLIERVADCRQRVVPLLCLPQRIVGRPGEGLKAASDPCIAAHFQVPNDSRDTLVDTWWSHTFRQTDSFFCRLRRGSSSMMPSCGFLHLWCHGHLEAKPARDGVSVQACHAHTTSPEGPKRLPRFAHTRHCFLRFGLGCENGWPVAKATFARRPPGSPLVLTSRSCGKTCSGQTPPRSFCGGLLVSTSSLCVVRN